MYVPVKKVLSMYMYMSLFCQKKFKKCHEKANELLVLILNIKIMTLGHGWLIIISKSASQNSKWIARNAMEIKIMTN